MKFNARDARNAIEKGIVGLRVLSPQRRQEYIDATFERIRELEGVLRVARCPGCDGGGVVAQEVTRTVEGCCGNPLPTGECCGVPVPEPYQDWELEPCQWCHERWRLFGMTPRV